MARNVAVQTITDGSDHENGDCSITHPLKRRAMVDALAIIDRHGHKSRDHQNPDDGDLVGRGHTLMSADNCRAIDSLAAASSAFRLPIYAVRRQPGAFR